MVPVPAMSLALRRGMAYPGIRVAKSRAAVTRAQLMLLEGAGEEEFTRWVKSRAHYYGWMGRHLRRSDAVLESVHTQWQDGFSEALGEPDWLFWHEDLGQHFMAELKGASGSLSKWQKRENPSLRRGGFVVFEWWPRDAPTIEHVFRYGLEGFLDHG